VLAVRQGQPLAVPCRAAFLFAIWTWIKPKEHLPQAFVLRIRSAATAALDANQWPERGAERAVLAAI
jgi:hypothetical protein